MATYDGTIRVNTKIDEQGFNKGVKSMLGSVSKLGAAIGIAFGIGAVVRFGQTAVNEASNLASALVGLESVSVATGNSFSVAKGFINEFTKDGLVPAQAAITAYKTLLAKGFDSTGIEKILNVTKDTAAFNRQAGLTIGEAIQRTAEGIKNENSVLTDSGGITKNLSIIYKEYADSIGTTVAALTEAQKRQAVLNGFEKEGALFAGDAARASNTYAGQISALGVSFLNLKIAVGNAIIPIIQKILPYIRAAVDALTFFFNRLATIIGILFGVNIGSQAGATADALGGVADGANAAADAQDNLGSSTEKAAKKAKGALAAFDQLNVLQQDTPTGGAGGAGVPDIGAGGVALPELDTTQFDEGLDEMRAKVLAWKEDMIAFFQPVTDAFWRLVDALKPLGQTIWSGLQWAWENILKPLGEWAVQSVVPAIFDLLAAGAEVLNEALIALQPLGIWLWENLLQPLAEWTGGVILDVLGFLTDYLKTLAEEIRTNQEGFQNLVIILGVVAGALLLLTSPVAAIIAAIAAVILIVTNWGSIMEWLRGKFAEATQYIQGVAKEHAAWLQTNLIDPIRSGFETVLNWLGGAFSSVFGGIVNIVRSAINSIIGFINRMLSGVASGINLLASIGGALGFSVPSVAAPQIPYLARGAVIPPNAEFAAILGDQSSGRNIEAPEGLIRQIIQEEIGRVQAEISITFDGTMGQFVRELKPRIDRENIRMGKSLLKGTA